MQKRLSILPPPPPEHRFFEITHKLGAFSSKFEACVDRKKTVEGEVAVQSIFGHGCRRSGDAS